MARLARVVVPHYPHHVTQRGNRRQKVFFCDDNYVAYITLMAEAKERAQVEVWAYCLMPNHVHLVVTPETESGLRQFFGEAHRHYTRRINFREGWRGYLWQGRFQSFVMDEQHLLAAVRYVELNPVRAGLARTASAWRWSSASAHLAGGNDEFVKVAPMLSRISNWSDYLKEEDTLENLQAIRSHTTTGRPLGNDLFLDALEARLGRKLRKRRPGPKRKPEHN
jgi:putative transposase